MTDKFWDATENGTTEDCAERARDALDFIVSHGGTTSRWKSLSITTDMFGPHKSVIDFLRLSSMPTLQYLELACYGPNEFDEEEYSFALEETTRLKPLPLFKSAPAQLRTVNLQAVSNPFLFGHPTHPQLTGLTRLELAFVKDYPDLTHFATLLSASPQLVALCLNMDSVDPSASHKLNRRLPKVRLHHLQEFALLHAVNSLWPLNVTMMLDAPQVDYLRLNLADSEADYGELIQYLADGGDKSNPHPPFPAVTHLMVWLADEYDSISALKLLLAAHPEIILLDLLHTPPDALLAKPWLARNLKHIRTAGVSGQELKRVVSARSRAKLPLKVVEADRLSSSLIKSRERKYLKGKVDFTFINFPDGDQVTYDVDDGSEDDDELYPSGYYVWD